MAKGDEVAIVGYAGRLPGASTADKFWSLLRDNDSSVSWVTPDRFPTAAFYHPAPDQSGRSYTFAAGLIQDVWGFDAAAFGMSPREAEQVDPQQRQLLEVTHDALAHAGIAASSLAGSGAGVYVGASSVDYGARFFADPSAADVHMMTGNTLSVISNRLSYNLDLHGPSFTVDTACSSSLVALTLAAEAIRAGTVETAIVGGVNLLLSPFSFVGFSRASMLSPTGRCRPFDAAADGYVRGEGALVVVLRSMALARKARNRIHASIVGSGVGQDGRTTGLSLPSAISQRRLLEQVYADFGIDPGELAFVEAHGTGTRAGDPMEADALGRALAQRRSRPLPIGSVKSNIGHLEPASGLAGVLKAILALNHGMLPATLHQRSPSPDIPFDELNLRVVDKNWPLPDRRGPSLAGVNSFGFGGTNAHVVLRGEDTTVAVAHTRADSCPPLLLSAHSEEALPAVARRHLEAWPADNRLVPDFIGAAAHLRDALPHRLMVSGRNPSEVRHHLERYAQGETSPALLEGQALGSELPVAYVFSGNGAQWAGMGRAAWNGNPSFREAIKEFDRHFLKRQTTSVAELLFADDLASQLRRATVAQPLLLALQVATVRSLEHLGVTPEATLGHSVGEIAAAWCAGMLSLKQAIDIVIARSRHQEAVRGSGAMAALMLGEREARRFLTASNLPALEIAAVNSWRSVTVAGPAEEIDQAVVAAARARVGARRLDLDYPFHSSLVDPVRGPLLRELKGLRSLNAQRLFVSTVTGAPAEDVSLGADHWWRNVRDPVQFEAGVTCLLSQGFRLFVEIGPKPILGSYLRDSLREANVRGALIETLTEVGEPDEADPIERSVARVKLAGGLVDAKRFFGAPPIMAMPLPAYPWRHTSYQVAATAEASSVFQAPSHSLLGSRPRTDACEWFSTIDPVLFPWILDHKVGGLPVFPAAAYVEVLMAAAREAHPESALELRDLDIFRPLVFDSTTSFETQVRHASETGLMEFLSRPRAGSSDWTLHARGILVRSPTGERPDLGDINMAGTITVQHAKVYEISRTLGFEYGEKFRRVRHVSFPHPKRAVATLESGVPIDGQTVDITAFDAAFHSLFASEEAGVADMAMKRMLPVRFGRVRAFVPGAVAVKTVAWTRRQSLSSIVIDIALLDAAGAMVLLAEAVRLIEAPVGTAPDANSLTYRNTYWQLDRSGEASVVVLRSPIVAAEGTADGADSTSEALLLMEAGCLRAAWDAFHSGGDEALRNMADADDDDVKWPAYLCSALLWHLETKGLVHQDQGAQVLSESCSLPAVGSVVWSLIRRHPTMAAEAAGLARVGEIVERLVTGDPTVRVELDSTHWRQLDVASRQISLLRDAVIGKLRRALSDAEPNRLFRLLVIGAGHAVHLNDVFRDYPGLEIVLTDLDGDRLEQAQAALGEDAPRLRCLSWVELEGWPAGTFDLVAAIDALSEIAATGNGLARLRRLLRPRAPLIAAEPAPSVFWDIVRGIRPTWWTRSANSDFPVGALLTESEWIDELNTAGFVAIAGNSALGESSIGVVLQGAASSASTPADHNRGNVSYRWEGDESPACIALQAQLQGSLSNHNLPTDDAAHPSPDAAPAVVVWAMDGASCDANPLVCLGDRLQRLAELCRSMAAAPAPLWVVILFDRLPAAEPISAHPLWCALSAALRVAQNEYPGLDIRSLGIAGHDAVTFAKALASAGEEIAAPSEEREVCFQDGQRLVLRIDRGMASSHGKDRGANTLVRLKSRSGSGRGTLAWVESPRPAPGAGEVEIAVAATGLNFRDVMWNLGLLPEEALEDGYAGAELGMECTGTISSVGPDVTSLAVGDKVVAFVAGGFSTHVLAPSFAVSPLPGTLTLKAAATLPVAFMTAYYSLVHLAGLKRGETVLVHGGAGAVGLAALQVSKFCGARLIATAGSEEKRALLRDLGADVVFNSRTLGFADEVMAHTQGKGVDVVLNSLAGEAMTRSMDCLRPFGRFVELGKRDYYANTHLGLRPFRRNLTYFGVDVDQLIVEHKDLTQRLFGELIGLFADGALVPLPHRVFEGERIGDAFRLMQRSGHIGKIVVLPAQAMSDSEGAGGRFAADPEGLHLVVGGTSGFGLATATWLAERGARHIVLASRSGSSSPLVAETIAALRLGGVQVRIAMLDVTDASAVQRFILGEGARRPVKGIVHAAMVLEDRLIDGLDRDAIDRVLQPKVAGALNLISAAGSIDLDYLLLYSSATTLLGNPGQCNYVAANGFVEGLAQQARRGGMPALAVAWGGIKDVGYLSRNIASNASLRKRFSSSLLAAANALDALDLLCDSAGRLSRGPASLAIARIDWTMARRELSVTRGPAFAGIVPATSGRHSTSSLATLETLRTMSLEQASEALLEIVVQEIASVLRLPQKEIDRHRPLADIGMDSLMMLELRSTVEATLQVDLPIMSLANGITPLDVARRIASLMVGDGHKAPVPGALAALSTSHVGADIEAMNPGDQKAAVDAVLERSRRLEGPL